MSRAVRCVAPLAMIAIALSMAGCGTVVDQAKLEAATQSSLEDSLHEKINSVDCPSGLSVDPGTTFDCDLILRDGQQKTATLEIRNEDADISIVGLKPTQ